jgi:hypothetical protein
VVLTPPRRSGLPAAVIVIGAASEGFTEIIDRANAISRATTEVAGLASSAVNDKKVLDDGLSKVLGDGATIYEKVPEHFAGGSAFRDRANEQTGLDEPRKVMAFHQSAEVGIEICDFVERPQIARWPAHHPEGTRPAL